MNLRTQMLTLALLLAGTALLAGCGDQTAAGSGGGPATTDTVVDVVTEHVGAPSSSSDYSRTDTFSGKAVGAEMHFDATGEDDGDYLSVAVGRGPKQADWWDCAAEPELRSGCVELPDGVLVWQDEVPEEDPGVIGVLVEKGDDSVIVYQNGPKVTGDPRTTEMEISVEEMLAIAKDPRVHL